MCTGFLGFDHWFIYLAGGGQGCATIFNMTYSPENTARKTVLGNRQSDEGLIENTSAEEQTPPLYAVRTTELPKESDKSISPGAVNPQTRVLDQSKLTVDIPVGDGEVALNKKGAHLSESVIEELDYANLETTKTSTLTTRDKRTLRAAGRVAHQAGNEYERFVELPATGGFWQRWSQKLFGSVEEPTMSKDLNKEEVVSLPHPVELTESDVVDIGVEKFRNEEEVVMSGGVETSSLSKAEREAEVIRRRLEMLREKEAAEQANWERSRPRGLLAKIKTLFSTQGADKPVRHPASAESSVRDTEQAVVRDILNKYQKDPAQLTRGDLLVLEPQLSTETFNQIQARVLKNKYHVARQAQQARKEVFAKYDNRS